MLSMYLSLLTGRIVLHFSGGEAYRNDYGAVHATTVVSATMPIDDPQHHTFPATAGSLRA